MENLHIEKSGEKLTFFELMKNKKIVIPIIQRDYAQGRKDVTKSKEIEIIRENFLQSLFDAISNEKPMVLDYIYGSEDYIDRFQPIDGQQRLTTLFLLHWYFSIKDKNLAKQVLLNFSYETRSSSTDFCKSLIKNQIDITNISANDKISTLITDCPWFHQSWQYDPTISSMLNMIDSIHNKFFEIEHGFQLLTRKENPIISFWTLSLENFGLSDDLFIKMNARGKKLSKFENFKAKFEDNLDHLNISVNVSDRWKNDIDNEWLDYFWKMYNNKKVEKDNIEMYMYKYILLVSEIINCKKPMESRLISDFSVDCNYFDLISKLLDNETVIRYLCDTMDFLIASEKSNCNYDLSEVKKLIDRYLNNTDNLTYSDKAYIFACIDFCRELGYKQDELFKDYIYLLKKLIRGQRTLRPDTKKYFSTIDARNIGNFLSGIDKILIKLTTNKNIIDTLIDSETKNITGISYLKHEIEKAAIINESKPTSQDVQKQLDLFENNVYFKGMIHNVINHKEKNLLLSYDDFVELINQKSDLILRSVASFSFILDDRYKGTWNLLWTKQDNSQINTYFREVYYKKFYGFSPDINSEDFGDILLTRDTGSIAEAVQSLLSAYGKAKQLHPLNKSDDILNAIIQLNLKNNITPYSQQYYFVKYPEFITSQYNVYGSRNNFYTIRKFKGENYESGHYNPFHKAVCRLVHSDNSIKVSVNYDSTKEKDSEELNPITLGNGIKMYLSPFGNWTIINTKTVTLSTEATNMLKNNIIEIKNNDCIQAAVEFIKLL